MGYITSSLHVISLLIINIFQTLAITTRFEPQASSSRNFRRHIGTLPFPDWELGLREAVYQALLRERNLHPNLREYLYSAPLLGRQDSATPFGDIAILARGQLYSAPGGFQFIQDPYQNDCDGCHNPPLQCGRVPCENWRPQDHERLLALWTVKRIRHRDSAYGYRFELEYKVTPMAGVTSEPFVTRNGNFDYGLPGHTFIVKADPRQSDPTFHRMNSYHDKIYRSPNPYSSEQWLPNYVGPNFDAHYLPPPPPPTEDYYDEDSPNGRPQEPNGYQNILFGPTESITKKPPYAYRTTKHPETQDETEHKLYKNLIDTLSSKTSTTKTATSGIKSTVSSFESDLFPELQTAQQTTKSLQSTSYTDSQLSSPTTSTLSYKQTTNSEPPFLPTIPMQSSLGTTPILREIPTTTYKEDISMTKPLFTPTMIRFPTSTSSTSRMLFPSEKTKTTPTSRFSESTRFNKYSEPDPLYTTTITPTLPTLTSKSYTTRSTKQYKTITRKYKTTDSIDFDLFGDNQGTSTTKRTINNQERPRFSNLDNINIEPGEQVITVINPPTMIPRIKEDKKETHDKEPSEIPTSHKHEIDFSNTRQLPPNEESYVTIDLHPSTRIHQQITSPTEIPTQEEFTTKTSSTHETTTITTKQTTMMDTTLSTDSSREFKHTKYTPPIKTTSILTKTTVPLNRRTTPFSYRTISSTKIGKTSTRTRPSSTTVVIPFTTTTTTTTTPSTIITQTSPSLTTTMPIKTTTLEKETTTLVTTIPTSNEQTTTTEFSQPSTTTKDTTNTTPSLGTTSAATTDSQTSFKTSTGGTELTSVTFLDLTTHPIDIHTDTTSDTTESTTSLFQSTLNPTQSSVATTYTMLSIPTTTLTTTKITTPILKTPKKTTESSTPSTTLLTKASTRKTPSIRGTSGDFLVEETPKKQDMSYNDDDFELGIFGPQQKNTSKPNTQTDQHRKPPTSKEIDDIFGSQAQVGDDYADEYSITNKPKVIFSNFYSLSMPTQITTRSTAKATETTTIMNARPFPTEPEDIKNKTTEYEPPTRQSYSTSVSKEVNKKSDITTSTDFLESDVFEPTTRATLQETSSQKSKYKEQKREYPKITEKDDEEDIDNNKIFDALALSVVNHARSIDYLHSSNCSTKEHKYKRKNAYKVRKIRRRN